MGATGGFEQFEHTADVGLRVWGDTLAELFEQAANGFIGVLVDPAAVRPARAMPVRAEGETPEELLVAWLNEVLFAFDALRFAPARARVTRMDGGSVAGELEGEDMDPSRHAARCIVKAVTYHDLAIRRLNDRYEVRVVFDI